VTSFSRQKPLNSKKKNHTIVWDKKLYHCAKFKLNRIKQQKVFPRVPLHVLCWPGVTDHGIFYPQALYSDLVFEITLAQASQVVKGSDATKLEYKLKKIHLQYEMIRSKTLADEAERVLNSGKEFAYDHVIRFKVVPIKKDTEKRINININGQKKSLKAILLLFIDGYTGGRRDSEKYVFPDLTKVSVTINGSPSMIYNSGIEEDDMWEEASRFFVEEKNKTENMTSKKFYTENKFGLLIDMRSFASQAFHGSGTRIVNSTDGVQLEIERNAKGSGVVNCHVFVISDAQFNIMGRQLQSVQN